MEFGSWLTSYPRSRIILPKKDPKSNVSRKRMRRRTKSETRCAAASSCSGHLNRLPGLSARSVDLIFFISSGRQRSSYFSIHTSYKSPTVVSNVSLSLTTFFLTLLRLSFCFRSVCTLFIPPRHCSLYFGELSVVLLVLFVESTFFLFLCLLFF